MTSGSGQEKGEKTSYAKQVKAEIAETIDEARHCRIASLAAMLYTRGALETNDDGEVCLFLQAERDAAQRKCFTILEKAFNIIVDSAADNAQIHLQGRTYGLVCKGEEAMRVLGAIGAEAKNGVLQASGGGMRAGLTRSTCCKRAFLRDAFLCTGSMSDPHGDYHLEFVCHDAAYAGQVAALLHAFEIGAKRVTRGKATVVYIKDGADIAALLNVIGAHKSLMAYEDLRILKEMRAGVNRRVNCDTANIRKVVNASAAQVERIRVLEERNVLPTLDESLRKAAEIRLRFPEATLSQLAELCDPPVSKSGMNHRLQKLMKIAEGYSEENV